METNQKKFTIVTPSFNQGKFIERTIRSIWEQEGDFYVEHIIADGGSTDETVEIINKYEKLLNNGEYPIKCKGIEFKWWSKKDDGQADALNKAFEISTGDILGWLNSDDTFFNSNSLKNISSAFDKYEADIITGNAQYIDESDTYIKDSEFIKKIEGGFLKQDTLDRLYQFDFIPQPSTFFIKKVYDDLKIDKKWYYSMDWDLWVKAYRSGFTFYKVDDFIGNMRSQRDAKTVLLGPKFYAEKIKFFKKYNKWGLNRIYCYIMLINYKFEKVPVFNVILKNFLLTLGKIKRVIFKDSTPVG